MKTFMTAMTIACCMIASASAVEPNPKQEPDVPETATLEIIRRGHSVEELGTFQAGPEADVHAINAPPEDDSDRWFLTLLVTDDPKYAEACDRIRQDINSLKLKGYVLPDKPTESWAHYSVRMRSTKTADKPQLSDSWFAKVEPLLEGHPYPHIVLQPPKNGAYGPNKTIAGIVHGYGDGSDYSKEPGATIDRLRSIIQAYSQSRYAKGLVSQIAGHQQNTRKKTPIAPPFTVDEEPVDLTQPRKVWPPHLEKPPEPPPAKPLTMVQIRKIIPAAPLSFRESVLTEGYTTEEEVLDAWDAAQNEVDQKPANPQQREPSPESSAESPILVTVGILLLIALGYIGYRLKGPASLISSNTSSTSTPKTGPTPSSTTASTPGTNAGVSE